MIPKDWLAINLAGLLCFFLLLLSVVFSLRHQNFKDHPVFFLIQGMFDKKANLAENNKEDTALQF